MPRILVDLLQTTGTKGGIEVYANELYSAIGALDTDHEWVGLASAELAATGADWFPGEIVNSGISGENRLAWARGELFAVDSAARRIGADLIHCPAMLGPWRSRTPIVLSIHDLLYFTNPELMRDKRLTAAVKWMEQRAAASADQIITISDVSAAAIRTHLGRESVVIPLAPRSAVSIEQGDHTRRDDLFIAIGQRSPYKDFETVVRAWAHLPVQHRPTLVVTGSHGDDPLKPIVAELGLGDSVQLREWVSTEELRTLFGTATALVDSTIASGYSLPAVEAMAGGLPLIMADTPVFREVTGDAALYFAAATPASLAQSVEQLRADPALASTLAERGRARVAGLSWPDIAKRTVAVFDEVLAARAT